MSSRKYYLDYYASLPAEIPEDELDVYEDEDFDSDWQHLNHERAAKVAVREIRKALKFLAEETDVVWGIEPVDYKEKFDGGYDVNAIVFYDSLSLSTEPLDMIREDES